MFFFGSLNNIMTIQPNTTLQNEQKYNTQLASVDK